MALTYGSLFAGGGGFDLGFDAAGLECRWQVELDDYATKILERHWPNARRQRDIREFPPEPIDEWRVDVICGGYPCQDLSDAGTSWERPGLEGERSGLWREYARVIESLRPKVVVVENVDGAAWKRWVPIVRSDLWRIGYSSLPLRLRACDVGAPFYGSRVFVTATDRNSKSAITFHEEASELSAASRLGGHWRQPAPWYLGVAHGIPAASHRLRVLGNAVVPQVSQWIGRRIVESLDT